VIFVEILQAGRLVKEFNVQSGFQVSAFPSLVEVRLMTGAEELGRMTIQGVVLIFRKLDKLNRRTILI
jgi:hypothetical protein